MERTERRTGFTLIEVIAVVLLTGILFGGAITYYTELSTRSNRAADVTRQWRHATALLDRVATDLERAYLLAKPDAVDPIEHPWLFVAESRYATGGADQLKFSARRSVELATQGPRSDVGPVRPDGHASQRARAASAVCALRVRADGLRLQRHT